MAATVTIKNGATWQEVAADRQKYRDATLAQVEPALGTAKDITLNTLPIAKQLLTEQEIKITETTVEDLVKQIANSEVSSVDVVKAFLRRAVLAQTLVIFLTY
jgi:amidase